METNGLEDLLLVGKNVTKVDAMTAGCDEQMALLAVNGTPEEINALYDHVQSGHLEPQDAKTLRMYEVITRVAWCTLMKKLSPFVRNPKMITKTIPNDVFELLLAQRSGHFNDCPEFYRFVDEYGEGAMLVTKWSNQRVQELKRIGWMPGGVKGL